MEIILFLSVCQKLLSKEKKMEDYGLPSFRLVMNIKMEALILLPSLYEVTILCVVEIFVDSIPCIRFGDCIEVNHISCLAKILCKVGVFPVGKDVFVK